MRSGIDVIHPGACMKSAMVTAQCATGFEEINRRLEKKYNVQAVLGAHAY